MNKKYFAFIVFSFILLSCSKTPNKVPNANNTLRVSFMHMPFTIDPRRTGDAVSSCMAFMAFEGLTYLETDGTCSNALAEKIDISDDKKVYTFHLRNARWTDGTPITAHDFEHSWKSVLSPDFPSICPYLFYPILGAEKAKQGNLSMDEVGIKAIDDRTFQVCLEHPTPYFLKLIAFCVFFPVPKHIDIENPNWFKSCDKNTICSGPFKIDSWRHDREITTVKNTQFWDADSTRLNGIHISIIPDQTTALQMYEQSKLDWVGGGISELSLDALTTLHKEGKVKSVEVGNTIFISYNINAKPFDNLNIRKAFAYAIDRQAITEHITQLSEKPATQIFPPVLTQHENIDLIPLEAKLAQAKEFFNKGIEEMGISIENFPKITLTFPSVEVYKKVAEAIQEQWRKAFGIAVETDFCEMKVFFDRMQRKSYQVAEAFWSVQFPDPMNILERFRYKRGNKNYPGWEDSTYLSLLTEIATTHDDSKRAELMRLAEKIIVDNVPLTPIYHVDVNFLSKPHVKGVEISPISDAHFRRAYLLNQKDV